MVNPYKCGRCKVFFDSDLRLLQNNDGAPLHHLPVSCMSCPYTICHVCYTDWLVDGKDGDISCPDCEAANGFHAKRPNVHPFACQLLAARATTAGAIVVTEQPTVAAMTPPLKSKQKDLHDNKKPAAAVASAPRARSNPAKQTRAESGGAETAVITREELEALENHDIIRGMNEWLKKVAKVSENNQRNIMRKVEILCAGDGLAVSTWPDGISFMKDSPVNLSMDFEGMIDEAKELESQYGRDPGNGWAMKHAISNLRKYQKYVLEEKLRKPGRPSAQSTIVSTPPKPKKQQRNHSDSEAEPVLTPSAKPAGRKQHRSKSESELEVTEEELVALENHEVVSGMREWLENVVKTSEKTKKSILAKVDKLCDGTGLHISTWPNDVSFMEGYEVNLSMDFDDMMKEAKAQEEKFGKDPGSGWAIRRPITYLLKYQRYVLEEKLRKLQPAVVTPSPKENKRKQDDLFNQSEPAATASAPPAKPAAKKQKLVKPKSEEIEVSEEEIEALENVDILSGISEWLDNVAKVSKTNKRNIMMKVEKLCDGAGIQVHGWPDSIFFMRGHKINLAMDFVDMLKEEKAYETKYGRDKSNGWGLRHPISNLRKYQKYVLEEKLRK